jgi:hypothetical protein
MDQAGLDCGGGCGTELGVSDSRDLHAANPFSRKTNFLCSTMRKVEAAATDEWATVVDADVNGAAVRDIGHAHHRAERERSRSSS